MKIEQILEHLSAISYVPVTYLKKGQVTFQSHHSPILNNLSARILAQDHDLAKSVECIFTDELIIFGVIHIKKDNSLVQFGPISALPCDNRRAQLTLRRYGLPSTLTGELMSYFGNLPTLSLIQFAHLLVFAHYLLTQKTIDASSLLPDYYKVDAPDDPLPEKQDKPFVIDRFHNSQAFENELYALVKSGKTSELNKFLGQMAYSGNEGILASDMLRNFKNLIICSTAITSRTAVEGGMDYEGAMRQADFFIQRTELASDLQDLSKLHHNMLKTFTRLVADRKIGNPNASLAMKTYNYVEQNIGTRLHAQQVANALEISRPYLCTQFKKETGMTLGDFICKVKVDEAKRLLTITGMSCADISSALDFSSQSHFQSIFKKYTGTTPNRYRKTNTHDH